MAGRLLLAITGADPAVTPSSFSDSVSVICCTPAGLTGRVRFLPGGCWLFKAGWAWLPEHYWQGVQAVSQAGQALSGPGLVEDRVEKPVLLGLEPLQLSKSHDPWPPAFARHDAGGPTTTGGCPRTWQATWRNNRCSSLSWQAGWKSYRVLSPSVYNRLKFCSSKWFRSLCGLVMFTASPPLR